MADYRLSICYRLGKAKTVLDSLSRPPCSSPSVPLRPTRASIVGSAGASLAAGQQATTSKLEPLERLGTIVIEPEWLGQVYETQTDPSDSEIVKLQADATSQNAKFKIVRVHGLDLVYQEAKPALL